MTALERLKTSDIRESPSDALIEQIRDKYPTEKEVDAVFTRKMQRRNGPPFQQLTLDRLVSGAKQLIEANLGYEVGISEAKWLSGGASKLQAVFVLQWRGADGKGNEAAKMVLRTEPAASITESSRLREFEVLKAVEGVIPAPEVYWVDEDGSYLPYPGIIMGFCNGVAKPSHDADKVSGLGQNYGPELRQKLAPQFVELLARLHTLDSAHFECLEHYDRPVAGSNEAVIKQVNYLRRMWEEDRIEEEPIMDVVYKWLIKHAPPIDHVSLIHGDYRNGNFLFNEDSGEITTWLDWEGAVLGDRHRDLTYATLDTFGHIAEDGETLLASGMMSSEELFAAYEKASGLKVDPVRLTYYSVYNRYLLLTLIMGSSARSSYGARTHQDVLTNYLTGLGYQNLSELCDFFKEVTQ
ncbi:MAG: phosphotransferase family protein [Porticoccaceae bacterium]|nr:phosphotransferase family protein [Pseudomonadales bacterium]MCP5171226.1 phosphotransferase family protein [Pseudomonadales bacterium]MCP5301535.1 phosphotransferase family protein [Pseudomonadales bacterium]